eukprot:gene8557-6003_t
MAPPHYATGPGDRAIRRASGTAAHQPGGRTPPRAICFALAGIKFGRPGGAFAGAEIGARAAGGRQAAAAPRVALRFGPNSATIYLIRWNELRFKQRTLGPTNFFFCTLSSSVTALRFRALKTPPKGFGNLDHYGGVILREYLNMYESVSTRSRRLTSINRQCRSRDPSGQARAKVAIILIFSDHFFIQLEGRGVDKIYHS